MLFLDLQAVGWRVAANRLAALASAASASTAGVAGATPPAEGAALKLDDLCLRTPEGRQEMQGTPQREKQRDSIKTPNDDSEF